MKNLRLILPVMLAGASFVTLRECGSPERPPPCFPLPSDGDTAAPTSQRLTSWSEFQKRWDNGAARLIHAGDSLPEDAPVITENEDPLKSLVKLAVHLRLPLFAPMEAWEKENVILLDSGLVAGALTQEIKDALDKTASSEPDTRQQGVRALHELEDARAERVMLHFLETDTVAEVRAEAAAGLRASTSRDALDALVVALADDDPWVAEHARYSIQMQGAERFERHLRTGMESADPRIAYESADILERAFGLPVPDEFWIEYASNNPQPE